MEGTPYRRHEPEKSVLHGLVREHLETFLAEAQAPDGDGYPRFIEQQFRKYLDCGILAHGFARLRCPLCGHERLVAFSCKGRLCPSCTARRAGDTAARLVDHLLPEAGYRQWVLTFPYTLRFRLAADRKLMSSFLRIFLQTVFTWQRGRGRALGILGGKRSRKGYTGAVTFLQRFGGALNCNPHLHSILPDGLWIAGAGHTEFLRFEQLPPPTTGDIEELVVTIARRLMKRVAAMWEAEGSGYLDPSLASLAEAFFFSRDPPVARRDPASLPGMDGQGIEETGMRGKPLCASVEGFSLHAAQAVGAGDREALERLLRYGLRAPFAQERFSLREDGKVLYRLRRPWPHERGATHLLLEPLDLLRRLAALVPFPYAHQVRYHGIFANRSRMRSRLPSPPRRVEEFMIEAVPAPSPTPQSGGSARGGQPARDAPRGRTPWAQLLRRVLQVDALSCPRCSSSLRKVPMIVLALLTDPAVIEKILRHLGLPCTPPPLAPPRHGPSQPRLELLPPRMQTEIGEQDVSVESEEGTPQTSAEASLPIRPPP